MNSIPELVLTGMSHDGRAVGRISDNSALHGMAVFVENAVLGQRILAKIVNRKKNFLEARSVQVLEQSPFFQEGICSHQTECGGCVWQNLQYEKQLEEKENFVKNSLSRLGGLNIPASCFYPILSCLDTQKTLPLFYRNKMEFAFSLENSRLKLGLRRRNSHDIAEINDCRLMPSHAMKILEVLRKSLADFSLPFYRYAVLRHFEDKWTAELITFPFSKRNSALEKQSVLACREALKPYVSGLVHSERRAKTDVAYGEKILKEYGDTSLVQTLRFNDYAVSFQLGNSAFFQVNTVMTEMLYAVVQDFAKLVLPKQNAQIWDFYCGVGSIGLSLAPLCLQNSGELTFSRYQTLKTNKSSSAYKKPLLLGVEAVEQAIKLAKENARLNQCDFAFFEAASAQNLGKYFKRFSMPNLIVLDPPRAGIEEEAVRAVLENSPEHLILVSCNAATLARDLAKLAEKYSVSAVQPVDLFPHTPHVETVVLLEKK